MGVSGSQAAAGQQSVKCQGAGRPGLALRAPAPAAYLSEAAAPRPEVPCAPSQMGTLAKDGLEALRGGEGFLRPENSDTPVQASDASLQRCLCNFLFCLASGADSYLS